MSEPRPAIKSLRRRKERHQQRSKLYRVPFALLGAGLAFGLDNGGGTVGLLLSSNVASVLSGAIIGPFAGAIAVLQYVDQRFRKEGFDIELVNHVQSRRQS